MSAGCGKALNKLMQGMIEKDSGAEHHRYRSIVLPLAVRFTTSVLLNDLLGVCLTVSGIMTKTFKCVAVESNNQFVESE